MENFILVVLDDDAIFAQRLQAKLGELKIGIEALCATDVEALNEIHANRTPQAYLVSASWRSRGFQAGASGARLIALEDARPAGAPAAANAVYRSDSMQQIAALLDKMLLRRTRVIGVFGVSGGAGNTTAFMGLALGFARQDNKRVFALNLEPCVAQNPFSEGKAIGLPDIMLAMDGGGNVERMIEAACCKYRDMPNIESFHPTEYDADRTELRSGDAANLLATMKRMNRWDVILVDLESRMSDLLFEVWQASEKMVMMIPHTAIGEEKLRKVEWDLQMRQRRGEVELEKLVPVLNFATTELRGFTVMNQPVKLTISRGDPKSVCKLGSKDWCKFLRSPDGLGMFAKVLDEVDK